VEVVKAVIHIDQLSKYYGKEGKTKAVDELDPKVHEGETFGSLVPNGAGKSWLALRYSL